MSNMVATFSTTSNYTEASREELEAKARMLDAIELNLAAVQHGQLDSGKFLLDMAETFQEASFRNYFNIINTKQ